MFLSGLMGKQVSQVLITGLMKKDGFNLLCFCCAAVCTYHFQDAIHVQKPVQI
jgi:hypothetical protein